MKLQLKIALFILIHLMGKLCYSQYLVSSTFVNTMSQISLNSLTGLALQYDVDMYKMIYNTTDVNGQPTIASGAFLVPSNPNCIDFPFSVYMHGTSLKKSNVPSNNNQEAVIGKVFSAGGYFTCMPDYIGMGQSPGLHPYIHAESEAKSAVDMLRAAREFISNTLMMVDNGELFITGYSQGGHACMATHKYIEDNNLQAEFNVVASAPCSGPYALSITMADSITSMTPYSNPGYITYMLASYQLVYGNIFNSWSEILKSPYDTIVPPFFSGSNDSLDMGQLNALLPSVVDSLIVDSVLNNFINDSVNKTHPLWQALLANDNYDWTPQKPVRMYYCTADEQVAHTNALLADSVMNSNGAASVVSINSGNGLSHNDCVIPALSSAFDWFQSLKTGCATDISSNTGETRLSIYPNPTSEILNIHTLKPSYLKVYSVDGKIITSQDFSKIKTLNVKDWKKGVYIIELVQDNIPTKKYFIKN